MSISQASKGRIQFTGLQDLNGRFSASDIASVTTIGDALNAQPIVDGEIKDFKFLETINLAKSGGITKGMDDDKIDEINSALADKTSLMQQYVKIKNMPLQKSMFGFGINDEAERKIELDRLDKEMKNQDLIIANTGQVFASGGVETIEPAASSGSGEVLSREQEVAKRVSEIMKTKAPSNSPFFNTGFSSTNTNISEVNNIPLSASPTSDVVRAFRMNQLEGL